MQIACERCATSYVLDDTLIPPQGAPVQCTRCGLVFTAKPPPAAPKGATTMMFGGVDQSSDPSRGSGTMMFGAVGTPAGGTPTPPPAASGTLIFGANANPTAPSAPKANSTMMFGASTGPTAPAPAAAKANSTMMFGAVGGPSAAAPAPASAKANSTMMFGAVGGPSAGAPAPAPTAGKPNSTMMFGAVAGPSAGAPAPAPTAGKPNSTMMFGAVGGPSAGAPAPAPTAGKPNSTMMFGAVPASAPAPTASKPNSTMMFGAPAAGTPTPAPTAKPNSTMMFGAPSASAPTPAPIAKPSSTMMFGAQPSAPAQTSEDLEAAPDMAGSDLGPPAPTPAWKAPPTDANYDPQPDAADPGMPAAPRGKTAAQPAMTDDAHDGPVPFPSGQRGLTMEMEAFSKQVESRNSRIVMGIVALGVIAILGGGAYWYTTRPKPPPPELVTKVAELLGTMEKDDPASLEAAHQGFAAIQPAAPAGFQAPLSGRLIAVSLIAADLRDQIATLRDRADVADRESKRIERDEKEKADWRARVATQVDEIKRIKGVMDPLVDQVQKLDEEQNALFALVKDARGHTPDDLDLTRSLGIYYGVKGDPTGTKFADHYRKFNATDGWADLITAAYGAQPKQTPDQLKASLAASKAAFTADGRMLRAKRLEAKIDLIIGDLSSASSAATILAAANPADTNTKALQAAIAAADAAKTAGAPAPH